MTDVFALLAGAGVQQLHLGSKEITGLCPMHEARTGRPDAHPSWSINRSTYRHQCFSCGYRGTLTGLLVDLTGAAPADLEETIKEESFLRTMEGLRERPQDILDPVLPLLTDWALEHILIDVPEKLLMFRRLRRAAVDAFQVRWDRAQRQWVMPIRDPFGELLGAQYRQPGSVLTLPPGLAKSTTLFGYRQMREYDHVVLVESPLDAVRLFGLGIPALSSLGAWVSWAQVTLMARCFATVILALDDDEAGHEGTEQCTAMLRKQSCAVVKWRYQGLVDEDGKPAKDVGDVESDDALLEAWASTQRFGL